MSTINALLILATLIMGMGALRGGDSIQSYLTLSSNRNVLQKTIENLESEIATLEDEIHKIKVSPEYAYRVLRDKYHLTEENEEIIFFAN